MRWVLAMVVLAGCGTAPDPGVPERAEAPAIAPMTAAAPELQSAAAEDPGEGASRALGLVVDRSGSMTGLPLEKAREACAAALDGLLPEDWVTVVAFDAQPFLIVPARLVGDEGAPHDAVDALQPGGGTEIFPALDMAFQQMVELDVDRKHVVALTDGRFPTSGLFELVDAMAHEDITLSVIGLGDSVDAAFLGKLASLGHGRFLAVADPGDLPEVLVGEVRVALR
jgi:Ca-activated chloride channel homolog